MATVRREREEDFGAIREAVFNGLKAYNEAKVGPRNTRPLALCLRGEDGTILGGLVGEFKWDWLHVDMLWIDQTQRGKGHGEALVNMAEDEARKRGAIGIYLHTGSRQAPGFYARLGYRECGHMENYPVVGSSLHHFAKAL